MNTGRVNLTLILFLPVPDPVGAVLGYAPAAASRASCTTAAIALSLAAFVASLYWMHDIADPCTGACGSGSCHCGRLRRVPRRDISPSCCARCCSAARRTRRDDGITIVDTGFGERPAFCAAYLLVDRGARPSSTAAPCTACRTCWRRWTRPGWSATRGLVIATRAPRPCRRRRRAAARAALGSWWYPRGAQHLIDPAKLIASAPVYGGRCSNRPTADWCNPADRVVGPRTGGWSSSAAGRCCWRARRGTRCTTCPSGTAAARFTGTLRHLLPQSSSGGGPSRSNHLAGAVQPVQMKDSIQRLMSARRTPATSPLRRRAQRPTASAWLISRSMRWWRWRFSTRPTAKAKQALAALPRPHAAWRIGAARAGAAGARHRTQRPRAHHFGSSASAAGPPATPDRG